MNTATPSVWLLLAGAPLSTAETSLKDMYALGYKALEVERLGNCLFLAVDYFLNGPGYAFNKILSLHDKYRRETVAYLKDKRVWEDFKGDFSLIDLPETVTGAWWAFCVCAFTTLKIG